MDRINRNIASAAFGLAVALATSTGANAQDVSCRGTVSGTSSVQQSLTPATDGATPARIKRSYDRAFAAGRRQAIAAWHGKVQQNCAGASSNWHRSRNRKVAACDFAMGGRFAVCASATPGRRR